MKQRYREHRDRAKSRGIGFLLTYEEWWEIWQASGYWGRRGTYRGGYVMGRFGDKGPYAVGNVKIIPHEQNCRESVRPNPKGSKLSPERRAQAGHPGVKHYNWGKNLSKETKAKKSVSMKQHYAENPETRTAISSGVRRYYETHPHPTRGKKASEATKAKLRAAWKSRRVRMSLANS